MKDYRSMKKDDFQKLYFKTFKRFFENKDDPQKSLMGFGLECHKGWYNLIWDLTESLYEYTKNNKKCLDFEIVQIKEKFGGLRFYAENCNDLRVYGMINFAEAQSYRICEECGERGELDTSQSYVLTLCPKCKSERDKHMAEKLSAIRKKVQAGKH